MVIDVQGRSTFMTYGSSGMEAITLPGGIQRLYTYQDGRVIQTLQKDPSGAESLTRFTYPFDLVRTIIDPDGAETVYEFDASFHLIKRIEPDLREFTFDYDAGGRLLAVHHPGSRTESWAYDPDGRLMSYTSLTGEVHSVDRDPQTHYPVRLHLPGGAVQERSFDTAGALIASKDPLARETVTTHLPTGQVESVSSPSGKTTRYEYATSGDLVSTQDPLGQTTRFTTDALGRVVATLSPGGRPSQVEYRGQTLVAATVDALGRRITFEYDDMDRQIRLVLPNGAQTHSQYVFLNGTHLLSKVTDPIGAEQSSTYDASGYLLSRLDPLGHVTSFLHDSMGRTLRITYPDGTALDHVYNDRGLLSQTTNARGAVTQFLYDDEDRLIETVAPSGARSRSEYDVQGRLVRSIAPDTGITQFFYNAASEQVATIDALGRSQLVSYDRDGNTTSTTDALGRVTIQSFDALNRVVQSTTALGFTNNTTFDADGNVVLRSDAKSHVVETTFDPLNRPVAIKNPRGHSVRMQYDSVGNTTRIEDENAHVWTMDYDLAGRKTRETDPNLKSVQYTYDLAGQLTSTTFQDGSVAESDFDLRGRVIERRYRRPDNSIQSTEILRYDEVGNRTKAENEHVRVESRYDLMDQEIERVVFFKGSGLSRVLVFSYDLMGRRTSLKDNSGREVRYTWNLGGQLTTLEIHSPGRHRHGLADRTYTFRYDRVGNLVEVVYPNRTRTCRSYDQDDRLTRIAHERLKKNRGSHPTNEDVETLLAEYRYTRDANANITRIDELRGEFWEFDYDQNDALIKAVMPQGLFRRLKATDERIRRNCQRGVFGTEDPDEIEALLDQMEEQPLPARTLTWEYDPAGNRTLERRDGQASVSTYSPANELLTSGNLTYRYSPRGDLLEKLFPSGRSHVYGYSVKGMMTSFARKEAHGHGPGRGGSPASRLIEAYQYSPNHERVGVTQVRGNRSTDFVWEGGRSIEEIARQDRGNSKLRSVRYVWGMGGLLEQEKVRFRNRLADECEDDQDGEEDDGDHDEDDTPRLGALAFASLDQLGSVRLMTGPKGQVKERTEWGTWGELLKGGQSTRVGYTGHSTERASGLRYSMHRYLDSRVGRWTQLDPVRSSGEHSLYLYVSNMPLHQVDPQGLFQLDVFPILAGVHIPIGPAGPIPVFFSVPSKPLHTAVLIAGSRIRQRILSNPKAAAFFRCTEPDFQIGLRTGPSHPPRILYTPGLSGVYAAVNATTGIGIEVGPRLIYEAFVAKTFGLNQVAQVLVHELAHWVRTVLNKQKSREPQGAVGIGEGYEAGSLFFPEVQPPRDSH